MNDRQHRRIYIKAAVCISTEAGENLHGWIGDLSVGGVFMKTPDQLPEGTPCKVTLTLRDGNERTRLIVPGKIVRCTEEGIGVAFGEVSDEVQQALSELVVADPVAQAPTS